MLGPDNEYHNIGTLCVIDTDMEKGGNGPRSEEDFDPSKIQMLKSDSIPPRLSTSF